MQNSNRGRDGGRSYGGGGRGGGYNRGGFRPRREMHDAVCAECKQPCQVPFKPSGDRPVYCRDCYMKKKDSGDSPARRAPAESDEE